MLEFFSSSCKYAPGYWVTPCSHSWTKQGEKDLFYRSLLRNKLAGDAQATFYECANQLMSTLSLWYIKRRYFIFHFIAKVAIVTARQQLVHPVERRFQDLDCVVIHIGDGLFPYLEVGNITSQVSESDLLVIVSVVLCRGSMPLWIDKRPPLRTPFAGASWFVLWILSPDIILHRI